MNNSVIWYLKALKNQHEENHFWVIFPFWSLELGKVEVNSTEIFSGWRKWHRGMQPKNVGQLFFSFYPLLLWVLRLFLDFYALDQFINPSFLVLEAEHDQDINSRPKPRWLETKVRSSLFFPFQRSKSWLDYAYLGASL